MIQVLRQRIANPTAASNLIWPSTSTPTDKGNEPELLAKDRAEATRAPAKSDEEEHRKFQEEECLKFVATCEKLALSNPPKTTVLMSTRLKSTELALSGVDGGSGSELPD